MTLVATLSTLLDSKPGDLRWYGGTVSSSGEEEPRRGWLTANGASLSKSANDGKYLPLFNEIGYTYGGAGDSFNLPLYVNGKMFVPRGANFARGATGGAETVTLDSGTMPAHTHPYSQDNANSGGGGPISNDAGGWAGGQTAGVAGHPHPGYVDAHENMPPYQVVGGILIRY